MPVLTQAMFELCAKSVGCYFHLLGVYVKFREFNKPFLQQIANLSICWRPRLLALLKLKNILLKPVVGHIFSHMARHSVTGFQSSMPTVRFMPRSAEYLYYYRCLKRFMKENQIEIQCYVFL